MDFMDELLAPIVAKGSQCVEPNLLFTVAEEEQESWWKIVLLGCFAVRLIIGLVGHCHERRLLLDDEGTREKFKQLPEAVTEHFTLETIEAAKGYQLANNCLDIIFKLQENLLKIWLQKEKYIYR